MFENKLIRNIEMSRYVASWTNVGGSLEERWYRENGKLKSTKDFINWLKTLVIDGEHLTDYECQTIWQFATDGKLELEESAKKFIKQIES